MGPHRLPTTSTVQSLGAGVAAEDHKMQAWNLALGACGKVQRWLEASN